MLCLKHYDKLSHESDDTPCYVCELDEARSRIAELEANPTSLRKDQERLDWLDDNGDRLADALMTRWLKQDIDIRAAIDAAMEVSDV